MRDLRYIATRVLIRLLIGVALFHYRDAHAQSLCPAGQTLMAEVRSASVTSSLRDANPPRCTVGQRLALSAVKGQCMYSDGTPVNGTTVFWRDATGAGCNWTGTAMPGNNQQCSQATRFASGSSSTHGTHTVQIYPVCASSCEDKAGQIAGTGSMVFDGASGSTICSSGCTAESSQSGGNVQVDIPGGITGSATGTAGTQWLYTGSACPPNTPPLAQSPKTIGDLVIRPSPTDAASLEVDGETVSLDQAIQMFVSQRAMMNSSTPTPPGPNNGNYGEPAAPDSTYNITNNNTTTTFNIYNTTTLNNSNTGDGSAGGPDSPSGGPDGDGDGDGDGGGGDGDGEGEGEGEEEQPPCEGTDCEETGEYTDTPLGPSKIEYERRYPDGLVGVWQSKSEALQATEFMQSVEGIFPTIAGGGTCPTWSMSLNFSQYANFGSQQFTVPCWVWSACALFLLITACFTARRIIFGG